MKLHIVNLKVILYTVLCLAVIGALLVPALPASAGTGYSPITVWLGTSSVTVSADDYATLLATYNVTITGTYGTHSFSYSGVPVYRIMEFAFPAVSSLTGYSVLTVDPTDYKVIYGPNVMDNTAVKGNNNLIIATSGVLDSVAGTNFPRSACSTFTAGNRFNNNVATMKLQYAIQVPAPTNGTITPTSGWFSGSNNPWTNSIPPALGVDYNSSTTFNLTPAAGYHVDTLTIDGSQGSAAYTYTFTSVTANHTIGATFTPLAVTTWNITVSAGANGSITPAGTSGVVTVNSGDSQTFTISPNGGYYIANVIVDGVSQGALSSYPFNNITANHTISASFAANFTVSIINGIGSSSTYNLTQSVFQALPQVTVTVTTTSTDTYIGVPLYKLIALNDGDGNPATYNETLAATNYSIKGVASDGFNRCVGPTYGITVADNDYLLVANLKNGQPIDNAPLQIAGLVSMSTGASSIATNRMVSKLVSLEIVYTISLTQSSHGTIASVSNPAYNDGTVAVSHGASQTFNLTADSGYQVASITTDAGAQTPAISYTFSNVNANHTLTASFTPVGVTTWNITTFTDGHGTVTANPTTVNSGGSSIITITPLQGYSIATVTDTTGTGSPVDVTSQVSGNTYTISNVTANHAVSVTFALIPVVNISVSPALQSVYTGSTFNLTLAINANIASRGWQANVNFDSTKLTANSVSEGGFLRDWAQQHGDQTVQGVVPTIDNSGGHITNIAYAIMGTANAGGPTGSGTLCTISFTARQGVTGSASITLSGVIVSDVNGATVPGVTVTPGTVTISAPPVNIIQIASGWNTFSTPFSLDKSHNTLGSILTAGTYDLAYSFNTTTQAWETITSSYTLVPCDAIYVHMTSANTVNLTINTDPTPPPSKDLSAGWNLISLANLDAMKASDALISIGGVTGGGTGYVQVISPSLGNQSGWTYIQGKPISDTGAIGWMQPKLGYWVFMINGGTLAGFTTTP